MRAIVSDTMLAVAGVIGLFLMMIGSIIYGAADRDWWNVGLVLKSIGMFALTAAMLVGGMIRVDMEKGLRIALILGAVVLISWVGFWGTWWF